MNIRHTRPASHSRGVTLIEILVTIVVLSVGLLGLAGMHFQGLKNNQSAYFRSQATILAYSAMDLMRSDRINAINQNYDIALGTVATADGSITNDNLVYWKNALQGALPTGDGAIDCTTNTAICIVTVQWDDTIGQGGSSTQQFSVTTQL